MLFGQAGGVRNVWISADTARVPVPDLCQTDVRQIGILNGWRRRRPSGGAVLLSGGGLNDVYFTIHLDNNRCLTIHNGIVLVIIFDDSSRRSQRHSHQ